MNTLSKCILNLFQFKKFNKRLEYLELENEEGNAPRAAFIHNRNYNFEWKYRKIYKKTSYTIIRLIFLFIFFYLDNFEMTDFIRSIVNFLLIHEAFVICNYIILNGYIFYQSFAISNSSSNNNSNNGSNNNANGTLQFPVVCSYMNSLNNM